MRITLPAVVVALVLASLFPFHPALAVKPPPDLLVPRAPHVLVIDRRGDCGGPPSPGERLTVSPSLGYRTSERRPVRWGLVVSDGIGPAGWIEPSRTRYERPVAGRGDLRREVRLAIGEAPASSPGAGVDLHTWAAFGSRTPVLSPATRIRLGATLLVRVIDEGGDDLAAGVVVTNGGCRRTRGDTVTGEGIWAAFFHLLPGEKARVEATADGYVPETLELPAGDAGLPAGRSSRVTILLKKVPPPGPQWSADQLRSPLRYGDTTRPVAYLTLDDGPGSTRDMAELLSDLGVRATFCLNGYVVAGDPSLIPYLTARGHGLCNHGWSHAVSTGLSNEALAREITSTEALFQAKGGSSRPFFRPPYGSYDSRTVEIAAQLGYRTIMWSVDPWDWRCDAGSLSLAREVLGATGWGSIILLHTHGCATLGALPYIVTGLRARGYSFETLQELPSWR